MRQRERQEGGQQLRQLRQRQRRLLEGQQVRQHPQQQRQEQDQGQSRKEEILVVMYSTNGPPLPPRPLLPHLSSNNHLEEGLEPPPHQPQEKRKVF